MCTFSVCLAVIKYLTSISTNCKVVNESCKYLMEIFSEITTEFSQRKAGFSQRKVMLFLGWIKLYLVRCPEWLVTGHWLIGAQVERVKLISYEINQRQKYLGSPFISVMHKLSQISPGMLAKLVSSRNRQLLAWLKWNSMICSIFLLVVDAFSWEGAQVLRKTFRLLLPTIPTDKFNYVRSIHRNFTYHLKRNTRTFIHSVSVNFSANLGTTLSVPT